jgi:hypothetical protein
MVASGKLGTVRSVSCLFAAPLGWLFEGEENVGWSKPSGSMLGNGFGWGQLAHTFAWVRGRRLPDTNRSTGQQYSRGRNRSHGASADCPSAIVQRRLYRDRLCFRRHLSRNTLTRVLPLHPLSPARTHPLTHPLARLRACTHPLFVRPALIRLPPLPHVQGSPLHSSVTPASHASSPIPPSGIRCDRPDPRHRLRRRLPLGRHRSRHPRQHHRHVHVRSRHQRVRSGSVPRRRIQGGFVFVGSEGRTGLVGRFRVGCGCLTVTCTRGAVISTCGVGASPDATFQGELNLLFVGCRRLSLLWVRGRWVVYALRLPPRPISVVWTPPSPLPAFKFKAFPNWILRHGRVADLLPSPHLRSGPLPINRSSRIGCSARKECSASAGWQALMARVPPPPAMAPRPPAAWRRRRGSKPRARG